METIDIVNPFPGASCFHLSETTSTMDEGRRLARLGFPPGTVIAVDLQSGGRGRFPERSWESKFGANLLFTIMLAPEAAKIAALPLRTGLALVRTVVAAAAGGAWPSQPSPSLKWPNDVLLRGRKVAGILSEAGPEGVFIGIGLNCNQRGFPPALEGRVTSLALEAGADVDRWSLLEIFLGIFKPLLQAEDWKAQVEGVLWRRGENVSFLAGLPGACNEIEGTLEGVDDLGSIVLRSSGGAAKAYPAGEMLPVTYGAS